MLILVDWSEEKWRRAIIQAWKRWYPTISAEHKCGFCLETLDGGRKEALRNALDHPIGDCIVCPIKDFCYTCGTIGNPIKSPETIMRIQYKLRELAMEHGVILEY